MQLPVAVDTLCSQQLLDFLADSFFPAPAIQLLSARIPELDHVIQIADDDGFSGELEQVGALLQRFGALADKLFQPLVQRFQLPAFAMQLREHADLGAQQFGDDRNGDVIHRALPVSLHAIDVGEVNAGDEDDGGLLKPGMLADHLGEIEAVHVGHADIGQHDADIFLQQVFQGFGGGGCLDEVLAQVSQNDLVAEQFRRLIVDHENVDSLRMMSAGLAASFSKGGAPQAVAAIKSFIGVTTYGVPRAVARC